MLLAAIACTVHGDCRLLCVLSHIGKVHTARIQKRNETAAKSRCSIRIYCGGNLVRRKLFVVCWRMAERPCRCHSTETGANIKCHLKYSCTPCAVCTVRLHVIDDSRDTNNHYEWILDVENIR